MKNQKRNRNLADLTIWKGTEFCRISMNICKNVEIKIFLTKSPCLAALVNGTKKSEVDVVPLRFGSFCSSLLSCFSIAKAKRNNRGKIKGLESIGLTKNRLKIKKYIR